MKDNLLNLLLMTSLALMLTYSCKKGEDSSSTTSSGTITDIDGNVYHTVTIGTQVWMVENLKTTKYRNGDLIPNVTANEAWTSLITGGYCWYNNDAVTYKATYGCLYNWYAVNDSRNIAPTGWHVPTSAEWITLENYVTANLGTSGSVDKALAAKTYWAASTGAGTIGNDLLKNNTTGFSAFPGGFREGSTFRGASYFGYWWNSTASGSADYGLANELSYGYGAHEDGHVVYDCYSTLKSNGFSVRCIRD